MKIKEIFEKVSHDKEAAFNDLYNETIDGVYRFVLLRTKDKQASFDICQDVYIDIFNTLSGFHYKSDSSFYKFLYLVSRRKIYKHRRSLKEIVSLDEVLDTMEIDMNISDIRYLENAISTLGEKERCVIENRYFGDAKFDTVAIMCRMSENNAKVVHTRAIKKLRSMLEGVKGSLY